MKNRALISAITVPLVLGFSGCMRENAESHGMKPDYTCDGKGKKCEVHIKVANCETGGSGISLDYPTLGVAKGSGKVKIEWTIDTPGYDFDKNDGIKFKPGVDYGKEFELPDGNKNKFTWDDRNDLGSPPERPYGYSVKITTDKGAPCATKDPTIVNDA